MAHKIHVDCASTAPLWTYGQLDSFGFSLSLSLSSLTDAFQQQAPVVIFSLAPFLNCTGPRNRESRPSCSYSDRALGFFGQKNENENPPKLSIHAFFQESNRQRVLIASSSSLLSECEKLLDFQMPEEDLVELKFRLYDGSDIGPFRYSPASTVAMLKERIVTEWPKDKKISPKGANDIKLINAGKILENNKTVGQCRVPFGELPRGIITMHVVVQPSVAKAKTEKKIDEAPRKHICSCSIL